RFSRDWSSDVCSSDLNSLKVKYEPDDQSDHNGKYRVHNKNAHPGISFVQKAFCANGNKGHVADDDDPVNKDIIDKDICPALLYQIGRASCRERALIVG